MLSKEKILQELIKIILDPREDEGLKSDAGMDLVDYDDDRALEALIKVSQNPSEKDLSVLEFYGETIGEYWVRRNYFSLEDYLKLKGIPRAAVFGIIELKKPKWIKKYELQKYGFEDELKEPFNKN